MSDRERTGRMSVFTDVRSLGSGGLAGQGKTTTLAKLDKMADIQIVRWNIVSEIPPNSIIPPAFGLSRFPCLFFTSLHNLEIPPTSIYRQIRYLASLWLVSISLLIVFTSFTTSIYR